MAPGYLLFGGSFASGAVSIGFSVLVGCPLTSPGREDMPGSLFTSLDGFAGRATLPELSLSEEEPVVLLAPVSVPEVVGLAGEVGEVGLVFVSSAGGVSEGEVRVRCIELESLRPCDASGFLECFFAFFVFEVEPLTDSFALPCAEEPLLTLPELSLPMPVVADAPPRLGTALDDVSLLEVLSGCCCGVFAPVSPEEVELAAGLLLGSELLLDEVFDELPGRALLF
jgi:hypothetical protein